MMLTRSCINYLIWLEALPTCNYNRDPANACGQVTAQIFLKYIRWQLAVMLVLLLVGLGIDGREGVLAIVIGSGIAILPNAYFTFQCFRYDASKEPMKAMAAFYRGEVGKIVLVVVLTALSFKYLELQNPLLLFTALFVMLLTQSFASVVLVQSIDIKIDEQTDTLIKPNKRD